MDVAAHGSQFALASGVLLAQLQGADLEDRGHSCGAVRLTGGDWALGGEGVQRLGRSELSKGDPAAPGDGLAARDDLGSRHVHLAQRGAGGIGAQGGIVGYTAVGGRHDKDSLFD